MMKLWKLGFILILGACSSSPKKSTLLSYTNPVCQLDYESSFSNDVLKSLKAVSRLYALGCYKEVIGLGNFVRQHSRDKIYHVFAETAEFIVPEGTFTEYVMESYERTYLSFLMAASYQQLAQTESSKVELRKAYDEGKALIYNYGDDPINLALQAVLWENSNQKMNSRPLWKKIVELSSKPPREDFDLKKFAEARIQELDSANSGSLKWKVYSFGQFPDLKWQVDFQKNSGSYFQINPSHPFAMTCTSPHSLFISTEAWSQKISHRHNPDYHPLLNFKSWTRLPVGVTVGVATTLAGIGVGVGGCSLAAGLASDSHSNLSSSRAIADLCVASIGAGSEIVSESGNMARYALEPDLRKWGQVPAAFLITQEADVNRDICKPTFYGYMGDHLTPLLTPKVDISPEP